MPTITLPAELFIRARDAVSGEIPNAVEIGAIDADAGITLAIKFQQACMVHGLNYTMDMTGAEKLAFEACFVVVAESDASWSDDDYQEVSDACMDLC